MAQDSYFLGRQPILDRQQNIVAFELLFRLSDCLSANVTDYLQASVSVILNALTDFGFQEVLGRHKGFVNVNEEMLLSDSLALLPKDRVVIELLEMIQPTEEVVSRCRDLNLEGFTLALDDHVFDPAYEQLYGIVDIIKIDILEHSSEELRNAVSRFRQWPIKLLAEKVETADQYRLCQDLGFDFFQGYYFAHPVVLKQNRIDIAKVTLLKLLDQLLLDASIEDVEETFKESPSLTYNLLRLVNSVALGLLEKIRTLRHAIMVLGQQQLKRWILLALFAFRDTPGSISPLLEMAAMRGKLMELLADKLHPGSHDHGESAFMIGILSLIDVLFGTSMEDITSKLNLTDDIRQALLSRNGELGELLNLVERLEKLDFEGVAKSLTAVGLSIEQLLEAQLQGINWTSKLAENM